MKNIRRRIRLTLSHFVYIYNMPNKKENENFFYKIFSLLNKNMHTFTNTPAAARKRQKKKEKCKKMHTFIDTQKKREKEKKKYTYIQTHNRKRVRTKKKRKNAHLYVATAQNRRRFKRCTPLPPHQRTPAEYIRLKKCTPLYTLKDKKKKVYTYTTASKSAGMIRTTKKCTPLYTLKNKKKKMHTFMYQLCMQIESVSRKDAYLY